MVLVTRSSSQGNLFKEATTPNWLDGDLWSDTTANILKLNVAGTAEDVGTELSSLLTTEGDIVYRNATIPASISGSRGICISKSKKSTSKMSNKPISKFSSSDS